MKVVILGGNAAGMSAASRMKRKAPDTEVIVLEKTETVSYGACGMPYYIADLNPDLNRMKIRPVEKFREQGIDVRLSHEVEKVDREAKTVYGRCKGESFSISYDKLLVATGSSPIVPPLPGIDLTGIYPLKTLEHAAALKRALGPDQDVVIVGGGYIGLELAEACLLRKVRSLTIVEAADHVLTTFDDEFGEAAVAELQKHGVKVCLSHRVTGFTGENGHVTAVLTDGGQVKADAVILSIGVRPNTRLIDGVDKLPNGALITDTAMRTSDPDIYAAGDCATVMHRVLKKPVYLALGTNANKQGRLAGDSMLGKPVCFDRALGTSMLRLMGLEFACTGVNEKTAKAQGIPYKANTVTARSHAIYYPDPAVITLKLIYDPDTKVILGAQLMGAKETALRIDVFACAIDRGMTTAELGFLDLGYAPPFASVWDAILIAANASK